MDAPRLLVLIHVPGRSRLHAQPRASPRTTISTRRGKAGRRARVDASVTGLWILLAVLVLSAAAGFVHRARDGRVRASAREDSLHPVLEQLGAQPGERATLLQFSSAFCAPCRATRRVLADVSGLVPGVAHVEVDAEQHLDVVRRLGILKTPTTLVLDRDGVEVKRASGQPRKADVLAALGQAVP
jgi:thiol-disulfide isomerase/thioredoxin